MVPAVPVRPDTRPVMGLLQRLRHRAIHSPTRAGRAYWLRALLRAKARAGAWDPRMLNEHPGNVTMAVKREIMRGVAAGLVVTSTTDGVHTRTSLHYPWIGGKGRAVDLGLRPHQVGTHRGRRLLVRHQRRCHKHPERYLELFGPDNRACVKNRARITLTEGTSLEDLHDNHLHIGPA